MVGLFQAQTTEWSNWVKVCLLLSVQKHLQSVSGILALKTRSALTCAFSITVFFRSHLVCCWYFFVLDLKISIFGFPTFGWFCRLNVFVFWNNSDWEWWCADFEGGVLRWWWCLLPCLNKRMDWGGDLECMRSWWRFGAIVWTCVNHDRPMINYRAGCGLGWKHHLVIEVLQDCWTGWYI